MLTQIYDSVVVWAIGASATIILVVLSLKAWQAVKTGKPSRMLAFALGVPVLVVVAVMAGTVATRIAKPLIEAQISNSEIVGAAAAGRTVVSAIDGSLAWVASGAALDASTVAYSGGADYGQQYMAMVGGMDSSATAATVGGEVVAASGAPVAEPQISEGSTFNGPWAAKYYDDNAPIGFVGPYAPEYYQGATDAQTVSDRPGEYVVAPGDSLSRIAKNVYGDSNLWPLICNANKAALGGNCNSVRVGQRLVIPAKGTTPQVQNAAQPVVPQYVAPAATPLPLVLRAAANGAQPTAMPLVLMAAQDAPMAQPTAIPLVLMAASD